MRRLIELEREALAQLLARLDADAVSSAHP
jgi:hypothetical protein